MSEQQQQGRDLSALLKDPKAIPDEIWEHIYLPAAKARGLSEEFMADARPFFEKFRATLSVDNPEHMVAYSTALMAFAEGLKDEFLPQSAQRVEPQPEPTAEEYDQLKVVLIKFFGIDAEAAGHMSNRDMYPAITQIVEQGAMHAVKDFFRAVEIDLNLPDVSEWTKSQLRNLMYQELNRYQSNPPATALGFDPARPEASIAHMAVRGQTPHFQAVDTSPVQEEEFDFLNSLEIDEDALEAKRNAGGEAVADDDADCEGCKI